MAAIRRRTASDMNAFFSYHFDTYENILKGLT